AGIHRAAGHGVLAAVEPETVHLLRRPVAAVTLLPENRLNVASKIHSRGRLREHRSRGHRHHDDGGEPHACHEHRPFYDFGRIVSPPGSFGRSGSVNRLPESVRSPRTLSPSGLVPVCTQAAKSSYALIISG